MLGRSDMEIWLDSKCLAYNWIQKHQKLESSILLHPNVWNLEAHNNKNEQFEIGTHVENHV